MPNIGFWATAGAGGAVAGAYELISSTILSSATSSVSFSSIPSTYKHLQIRMTLRGSNTIQAIWAQLNGDTTNSYARHNLRGNNNSVFSGNATSQTELFLGYPATSNEAANIFGTAVVDILDYTGTKNKTVRSFGGVFGLDAGSSFVSLYSGLWLSTNTVNAVAINHPTANWIAGSRFSLYGVKG